jgi:hypothetical protein
VARRFGVSGNSIGLFLLLLVVACQTAPPATSVSLVRKTIHSSLQIPLNVERLAVLYPKTYSRELLDAYARLEGAVFQLKEQRPFLRIVDRFDLPTLRGEQRFQLGGAVSDESAIRLGRLLGVDSVLFFRIEGPNFRDQVFAKFHGDLPPFTVMSKIILVESAEVVFHNVVTSPVERSRGPTPFFYSDLRVEPQVRAALDRGVVQTIADLSHAFR